MVPVITGEKSYKNTMQTCYQKQAYHFPYHFVMHNNWCTDRQLKLTVNNVSLSKYALKCYRPLFHTFMVIACNQSVGIIWQSLPWHILSSFKFKVIQLSSWLTAHNWQKWKRVFLTCLCHEIYRDEAVGLKSCKYTWKITIFLKMWNLGQYLENLIFCQ